jgi:hypothetical protein
LPSIETIRACGERNMSHNAPSSGLSSMNCPFLVSNADLQDA